MTIESFSIIILTLFVIIQVFILLSLRTNITTLKASVEIMMGKYMLVVRSLGVAEGNVEGIASQIAKQDKIDEVIVKRTGSQEITGIVKGTITPRK